MSGVTTAWFRQEMLQQMFSGVTPTWDNYAVCLTRKVPTSNSAVNQLDEPSGLGYERQQIARTGGQWALQNGNEFANTGTLYFPTALGSWGTCHGWAIITHDAGAGYTGSKVCAVGTLAEPIRVISGVRPYLGPGSIIFGLYDSA